MEHCLVQCEPVSVQAAGAVEAAEVAAKAEEAARAVEEAAAEKAEEAAGAGHLLHDPAEQADCSGRACTVPRLSIC